MKAEKGKFIVLDYEGRLESGEIFDTSKHGDHSHPLTFQLGEGQIIPGFEKAVTGMDEGEEKEFTIKSEEAYGEYDENKKQDIPKSYFPEDKEIKAGSEIFISAPDGRSLPLKVVDVNDENVTIDLNHPLAGKDLIFKIKILEIKDSAEDLEHQPHHHDHEHSEESEDSEEIMDEDLDEGEEDSDEEEEANNK